MRKPAYSNALNFAIILWGVRAGVYALAVTTAASFLVGVLITIAGSARLVHLGEYQPWMPIIGLEYGFVAGIVVGLVVGWMASLSCLRRAPNE